MPLVVGLRFRGNHGSPMNSEFDSLLPFAIGVLTLLGVARSAGQQSRVSDRHGVGRGNAQSDAAH